MSDLISRKAAIEKIVSLKRERNPLTETDRAMNYILEVAASCLYYLPSAQPEKNLLTVKCEFDDEELRRAIEAVKNAELELITEQRDQRWIPLSQRLPEKGQTCLVCDDGVIAIDKYMGIGNPLNWDWYDRDYEAWMPLPPIFRGE